MKYLRVIGTMIITILLFLTSIIPVNGVTTSIQLGNATDTGNYIAGVGFSQKVTTDGKILYCINKNKSTAKNIQANLVTNSTNITGGLVYILENGYPNKSITGDSKKDYYITQTALWWYLDLLNGSTNLGEKFKVSGSDNYQLRQYVRKLAQDGFTHRNDSISSSSNITLKLNITDGNKMILKDNYFISNPISANVNDTSTYNVSLENAPTGTKILVNDTTENDYNNSFIMNGSDSFRIKIPASSLQNIVSNIKVNAKANATSSYTAYEYQPVNTDMQNVVLLEKETKEVTSSIQLNIEATKVTIYKRDTNTKQNIAGAKMVLKDSTGKEITNWTSTENAHIVWNLSYGSYTIEEQEAPNGYYLNTNVTNFTLSENQKEITVYFENAPKKVLITINKLDQTTNKQIPGAVIVVKNSAGAEIARFTTTENAYTLTDIPNGTYTVEEISAPIGYIKSNDILTFIVDEDHLSHQLTFMNGKEITVPDTDISPLSSIVIVLLGIGIIGVGIYYIKYEKAK